MQPNETNSDQLNLIRARGGGGKGRGKGQPARIAYRAVFPGVLPLRCYPEKCYPQSKTDENGVPPCVTPAPMLLFSAYSESYPGQHGLGL